MFDKKKKRSSSLVRDELRDTDWPDSVSVTGDEPTFSNGGGLLGGKHDTGAGYPGHGRKYSAGHQAGNTASGLRQVSDRKTDIEKLYWNGSLVGAGAEETEAAAAAGLGPGNKRPDINGFNHSATAAFDVIDKTFWNEKNQSFEDQKATEAHVDKVFEQKRKAAAAAASHGGQVMKSYQQQVNNFQNQFGSGEVEKFHWNDKVPGEEEGKSNKQTSASTKMISAGTGVKQHQPSTRKSKLNGMREFQNFNDEEKLYWNEKLHQFSAVKQQAASNGLNGSSTDVTRSGKETANGYPTSYQNFLDDKLGWNDKVSDMFAAAIPTVSSNGNVKHQQQQQQQGMYRSYFQTYEAAAAASR